MKKKIVVILVVVVVVAGVVIGVIQQPYRIIAASIKDIEIYVDESMPPTYFLRVVAGGGSTCMRPWRYCVTRLGNTIVMVILTLHHRDEACGCAFTWEEKTINLGRCFIPGTKHWVHVNYRVETFMTHRLN
jgi:hypothetical protein